MEAGCIDWKLCQILKLRQPMFCTDRYTPRQSGWRTVKFLINKVRNAPNPLTHQHGRSSRIEKEPDIQLILVEIIKEGSTAQQQTAKNMQAAVPNLENFCRVIGIAGVTTQSGIDHIP